MHRALVIKTSALGDVVQVLHVLPAIKQMLGGASIDWVTEKASAELLSSCPLIDRVLTFDSKNWRKNLFSKETHKQFRAFIHELRSESYDVVIDFQGNVKSGLVMSLVKGNRKVGYKAKQAPEWPNAIFSTERFEIDLNRSVRHQYLQLVENYSKAHKVKPSEPENHESILKISEETLTKVRGHVKGQAFPVMLSMGSNWINKYIEYPYAKGIVEALKIKYPDVDIWVSWGSEEEKSLAQVFKVQMGRDSIHVMPKVNLLELAAFQSQMKLVISADSLPLHLAAAVACPTFSIFGPSLARKYAPPSSSKVKHVSWQGECPYKLEFKKRCPKLRTCSTGACLKQAEVSAVTSAFKEFLKDL